MQKRHLRVVKWLRNSPGLSESVLFVVANSEFRCFRMESRVLLMPFSFHPFGYVKVPFGILYLQPLAIMAAGLLQFS